MPADFFSPITSSLTLGCSIASAVGASQMISPWENASTRADTIMDVNEPFLLQMGFLDRTRRGRVATRRAYEHLGFDYPKDGPDSPQASLF